MSTAVSQKHTPGMVRKVQRIRELYKEKYAKHHKDYDWSCEQIAEDRDLKPRTVHLMISGIGYYKGL